jgi:hypothetical protein
MCNKIMKRERERKSVSVYAKKIESQSKENRVDELIAPRITTEKKLQRMEIVIIHNDKVM